MNDFLTIIVAIILLILSGSFSGLNIGMMMARPDDLRRKAAHGDRIAERVYRYRKDGYYLIFCILLGNVGVNTSLAIILGSVTSGVIGGLIATALITAFGEILPQAIFSQRGYRLTRYFFWLLDIVYVLFWPVATPVSRLLSRWIGKEPPQLYTHEELQHIVHEHAEHSDSPVDRTESQIISGALSFSRQRVYQVMTPLDNVTAVQHDDTLTEAIVDRLHKSGHSRIPVQGAGGRFVGVVYMKDLAGVPLPVPVSRVYRDTIHDIDHESWLDTALNRFTQTRSHIAYVEGEDGEPIGILTLEDVIEQIIQRPIIDEHDPDHVAV